MKISRLSHVITTGHMDKPFKNRFSNSSLDLSSLADTKNENWTREYLNFMKKPSAEVKQMEHIAESKARDELVLAAMNLSEEIVRRLDGQYKPVRETQVGDDSTTPTPSRGRKRGPKGNRRRQRGGGRHGADQFRDSHEAYQDDDYVPSNNFDTSDEGTKTSTEASSGATDQEDIRQKSSPLTLNHQDQNQDGNKHSSTYPTPEPILSDVAIEPHISTESAISRLSHERIDCLNLALSYLPAQEQQAVRSRLSIYLAADKKTHSLEP